MDISIDVNGTKRGTPMSSKALVSAPGRDWIAVVRENGTNEFATAFVAQPLLYASVLNAPCIGVDRIAAFFAATSGMYDTIAFTHETKDGSKTCLEWAGKVFGEDVGGTTILTRDDAELIESVQLYHRPLHILVRFSAELRRRLQGKLDAALFDIP
jgi:hypothetical protein